MDREPQIPLMPFPRETFFKSSICPFETRSVVSTFVVHICLVFDNLWSIFSCWLLAIGCWLVASSCQLVAISQQLLPSSQQLVAFSQQLLASSYWLVASSQQLVGTTHQPLDNSYQLTPAPGQCSGTRASGSRASGTLVAAFDVFSGSYRKPPLEWGQ